MNMLGSTYMKAPKSIASEKNMVPWLVAQIMANQCQAHIDWGYGDQYGSIP